jgi:hypothetical protein
VRPEALKRKFNHGLLFESYFYRDSNRNEIDLVLESSQDLELQAFQITWAEKATFSRAFDAFARDGRPPQIHEATLKMLG